MGGSRGLVKKGGLLLITASYCWSERTAASQLWLGGTTDSAGKAVRCAPEGGRGQLQGRALTWEALGAVE